MINLLNSYRQHRRNFILGLFFPILTIQITSVVFAQSETFRPLSRSMLNRPQNAQLKNAKPLEFPPDDYLREIIETPEKFTRKAHEIHYLSSLVFYQIESADYLLIDAEHMKLSLKLQQPTLRFVISKKLAEEMSRTGVIKKSSGDNPTFWNVRFSVEPDPRTDGKYIGRVYWTELVNIRDVVLSGGAAGKTRFEDLNWRPK